MKRSEDEPTALWNYTRALLAFRIGGDCSASRTELCKALKVNKYVIPQLLSDRDPDTLPESYSIGSRDEAIICARGLQSACEATPGILEWLANSSKLLQSDPRKSALNRKQRDRGQRRKQRSKERKRKRH